MLGTIVQLPNCFGMTVSRFSDAEVRAMSSRGASTCANAEDRWRRITKSSGSMETSMQNRSKPLAYRVIGVMGLCAVALAGCGKKDQVATAPRGQVVARVGDEVVTTQELENEF